MYKEVLTLINKLDSKSDNKPLRKGSSKVKSHRNDLQTRFPEMSEADFRMLAILFQHYALTKFTDEELISVTKLRIPLLDSNINQTIKPFLVKDNGLFDTGSYRINKQLTDLKVSTSNLNYLLASGGATTRSLIKGAL